MNITDISLALSIIAIVLTIITGIIKKVVIRMNQKEAVKELERLAQPLRTFLLEHYNCLSAVVITADNAKVVSVEISTPIGNSQTGNEGEA